MGALQSKHRDREQNSPRKLTRRTNRQSEQPTPQNPVATPVSLQANISTAQFSLQEEVEPQHIPKAQTPPAARAFKSDALQIGSTPSTISLLSKATGKSARRLLKVPAMPKFDLKRLGRTGRQSHQTRTPSPSPPTTRPLPETRTNGPEGGTPYAAYDGTGVQQPDSGGPGVIDLDEDSPQTPALEPSLFVPSQSLPNLTAASPIPQLIGPDITSRDSLEVSGFQPRHHLSLSELRNGLLPPTPTADRENLNALDCTGRLEEKTKSKGSGAFSDVSQAKLGDRLVAVKALRATNANAADEPRMRKRLAREIHVWAALDHPNILEFIGFAFEDGLPCLISPWCGNGTLVEYLQNNIRPDRRLLVRQIAEGLNYLHTRNPPITHGDFKTANVLITDDHIAKLCDFGGSKYLKEGNTGFTTTGILNATIRYCAPEILKDGQSHTLPSDVYSFACVALETMTGRCPFWKIPISVGVISKIIIDKQTPSPVDHPELQDATLWVLLRRCWSHEPSARPTMTEVCRTLAAAGYGPLTAFYPTAPGGVMQPGID